MARRIYVAGPMSGFPNLNHEAFFEAEEQLKKHGWQVVNPARMDLDAGIDPAQPMAEYDYEDAARRDIEALKDCDAIYLMAGWQHSRGACWERALAVHFGLRRYYQIPREDHS